MKFRIEPAHISLFPETKAEQAFLLQWCYSHCVEDTTTSYTNVVGGSIEKCPDCGSTDIIYENGTSTCQICKRKLT